MKPRRRPILHLIAIAALLAGALAAPAQRTTRGRLRPAPQAAATPRDLHPYDTIATAADSGAIHFSGYEKTLSSTKESFFATNHTDSLITILDIRITYLDMKGRQLDTRTLTLPADLPAGETRRFDIPTWDRQKTFYYHISPTPRTAQATPYRVTIHLRHALKPRKPISN